MNTTSNTNTTARYVKDEVEEFSNLLSDVIRAQGVPQQDVALSAGIGQSTLSKWVLGRSSPAPRDVFRLEAALGLPPGFLSESLGFRPLDDDAAGRDVSVGAAIAADERLDEDQRDALLTLYRFYIGSSKH